MELSLHIGLPKTGTTVLQKHLFSGMPGYLGKSYNGKSELGFGEINHFSDVATLLYKDRAYLRRETESWVRKLDTVATRAHTSQLFLSFESLSRWYLFDYFTRWPIHTTCAQARCSGRRGGKMPLANYLEQFLLPVWGSRGKIRVVITLRNQADYLASLYAQVSGDIWGANQENFERQVYRLIDESDPSIDWFRMVEDLRNAVGKDNVGILLFEEFGSDSFKSDLIRHMGLEDILKSDRGLVQEFSQRENTRTLSRDEKVWSLSPVDGASIRRRIQANWSDDRVPVVRKAALKALRSIQSNSTLSRVATRCDRSREGRIRLSTEVAEAVRDHCKASNSRLADSLNKNLENVGY